VRTFLRILEEKGYLKHKARGRQYVYRPATPISRARWSAVQRVLKTFFDGSLEKALALYLSHPQADVSREELQRLEDLIREARQKEGE
jgi:predicted transcriptional regulator